MNLEGWECPKCHAVMSPTYPTCFYCKPSISHPDVTVPYHETLSLCKHGRSEKLGCTICYANYYELSKEKQE